jgi:hypothetical protein
VRHPKDRREVGELEWPQLALETTLSQFLGEQRTLARRHLPFDCHLACVSVCGQRSKLGGQSPLNRQVLAKEGPDFPHAGQLSKEDLGAYLERIPAAAHDTP